MRRVLTGGSLCLVVIGMAVALTACGSSSSDSSTALTKAEFLKQGNAICRRGNKEIGEAAEKEFPHSGGKPNEAKLEQFANQRIIPNIESQVQGISDLPAPEGDAAQVEAIVEAAEASIEKAKEDPSLMIDEGGEDPFAKPDELATEYGLTACASEGEKGH
jgi:hypothetical protein